MSDKVFKIGRASNDQVSTAPLRVGVIGAGNMGQHHLRVYNMQSNAKLVGVVDIDQERAKVAAAKYNCNAYKCVEDLIGKVDAVTIAVPSNLHTSVGEFFLNNNVHCLIEKPLAITESECSKLIKIAEKKGVILLVGHVEHFNPGLLAMRNILKHATQIYSLEAKRMGFNTYRIPDIDVVLDLMVHDLEIVHSLQDNEEIVSLEAQGIASHVDGNIDQATSLLSYSSGAIATLTTSWVSAKKTRTLEVNSDIGTLCLDYATQKLIFYRRPDFEFTSGSLSRNTEAKEQPIHGLNQNVPYQREAQLEYIAVRYQEPLLLEVQNFLQSVDSGVTLGVNGYQALNALKLAWKIQNRIRVNNESFVQNSCNTSQMNLQEGTKTRNSRRDFSQNPLRSSKYQPKSIVE